MYETRPPPGIPGIPGIPAPAAEPSPAKQPQPSPAASALTVSRGTVSAASQFSAGKGLSKRFRSGARPTSSASALLSPSEAPSVSVGPPAPKPAASVPQNLEQNAALQLGRSGVREAVKRERSPGCVAFQAPPARPAASSAGLFATPAASIATSARPAVSTGTFATPAASIATSARPAPTSSAGTSARPARSISATPTGPPEPAISTGTMDTKLDTKIEPGESEKPPAEQRKTHLQSKEADVVKTMHEANCDFMGPYAKDKGPRDKDGKLLDEEYDGRVCRDTSTTDIDIEKRSRFDQVKLEKGCKLMEKNRYGLKRAAKQVRVVKGQLKAYWEFEYKHCHDGEDEYAYQSDESGAFVPANTGLVSDEALSDVDEK